MSSSFNFLHIPFLNLSVIRILKVFPASLIQISYANHLAKRQKTTNFPFESAIPH